MEAAGPEDLAGVAAALANGCVSLPCGACDGACGMVKADVVVAVAASLSVKM